MVMDDPVACEGKQDKGEGCGWELVVHSNLTTDEEMVDNGQQGDFVMVLNGPRWA